MMRVGQLRLVGVLAVGTMLAAACVPAPSDPSAPARNPDLAVQCGLDVNLVVDRSGSIGGDMDLVKGAAGELVSGLEGTGSRVRFVSFAESATGHTSGQDEGSAAISDLQWTSMDGFQVPDLTAEGGTNWEDGLEMVRRASSAIGDLTVVITDGNPNLHGLQSPDGHGTPGVNLGEHLNEAVSEANKLKQAGSHMLAVGVGSVSQENLVAVSGPDAQDPAFPIIQVDYMQVSELAELPDLFRQYVKDLCDSSISLTLWSDKGDGKPVPLSTEPWPLDLFAAPEPVKWEQPLDASGPDATIIASKDGTATAVWAPAGGSTTIVVTDDAPKPYRLSPVVTCKLDVGQGQPTVEAPVTVTSPTTFAVDVPADGRVRCDVVHLFNT